MAGARQDLVSAPDRMLIALTRAGDSAAYAELYSRHSTAAFAAARRVGRAGEIEDIVAEAFARLYRALLTGTGPEEAFRPYLYAVIRNIAMTWDRHTEITVDDFDLRVDPISLQDHATTGWDHTATAEAFLSLPDRWQAALWYTEVEQMDTAEAGRVLGLGANGVAALSFRAREGLRRAWLQRHLREGDLADECLWTTTRLGTHARNGLGARDAARADDHLADCESCTARWAELDDQRSRLHVLLLPLFLGVGAGGAAGIAAWSEDEDGPVPKAAEVGTPRPPLAAHLVARLEPVYGTAARLATSFSTIAVVSVLAVASFGVAAQAENVPTPEPTVTAQAIAADRTQQTMPPSATSTPSEATTPTPTPDATPTPAPSHAGVTIAPPAPPAATTNLLADGGFEGTVITASTGFSNLVAGDTIGAWQVLSHVSPLEPPQYPVVDGTRSLDLDGGSPAGAIAQTIATVPGRQYLVSLAVAGEGTGPRTVQISVGGTVIGDGGWTPSTAADTFVTVTATFTATSTSSTLQLKSDEINDSVTPIDHVSVVAL